MSTYDQYEQYDLDKAIQFNFNPNFDLLKAVLDALLKRQKETTQSINDLHSLNQAKDERIGNLEKEILNLTILLQENLGNSDKLNELKEKRDQINKQLEKPKSEDTGPPQSDPNMGKISDVKGVDDTVKLAVSVANDEITNKLIKKINAIEQTVNNLAGVLSEVSKLKKPVQEHTDQLRQHDTLLYDLNNRMNQLKTKSDEHDKHLQDILVKMEDFNIVEILKNANAGEGGDNSVTLGLISNLEKKTNQKLKFIDERSNKQDEEIFKMKNELTNLKNAHDQTVRNVTHAKDHLEIVDKDTNEIKKTIDQLRNEVNDLLEKSIEELKRLLDEKINGAIGSLDNKVSEMNDKMANTSLSKPNEDSLNQQQSLDANKSFKEINKHLNELEKTVKLIPGQINIEAVWREINTIKDTMTQKVSVNEHQELRDIVLELQKQVAFLKDQLDTLLEDQSSHDEIQQMKKKMESMNNAIHNIKASETDLNNNNSSSTKIQIDTTKFVETVVFNEFRSSVIKEFENVNENLNQLKRIIDELINAMKSKTSYKDLKALEDDLTAKLEDLKLMSNKRYADKTDTTKNLKYLDQQIKHIVEVYIKKMEKGDSWLLAKKPLGGHLCASCETYIGDLKEGPQYVPWNKYPMRDPNDKLYRIGNGFSKMLQMITVDNPSERNNNFQTSQDFYCNTYQEGDKRDHSDPKKQGNLPKINRKNPKMNVSNDEVMDNMDDINAEVDQNQPKITKIYKKNKKNDS